MTYGNMSHIHVDIGPRFVSLGARGRGYRFVARTGWRDPPVLFHPSTIMMVPALVRAVEWACRSFTDALASGRGKLVRQTRPSEHAAAGLCNGVFGPGIGKPQICSATRLVEIEPGVAAMPVSSSMARAKSFEHEVRLEMSA